MLAVVENDLSTSWAGKARRCKIAVLAFIDTLEHIGSISCAIQGVVTRRIAQRQSFIAVDAAL